MLAVGCASAVARAVQELSVALRTMYLFIGHTSYAYSHRHIWSYTSFKIGILLRDNINSECLVLV